MKPGKSQHQKKTVERDWQSLFEIGMLFITQEAKIIENSADILSWQLYIWNQCYNLRSGKMEFEMLSGTKPNISSMHIFSTTCHTCIWEKKLANKLDSRDEKATVMVYDKDNPAYFVFFRKKRNLKSKVCVKFNKFGTVNDGS